MMHTLHLQFYLLFQVHKRFYYTARFAFLTAQIGYYCTLKKIRHATGVLMNPHPPTHRLKPT